MKVVIWLTDRTGISNPQSFTLDTVPAVHDVIVSYEDNVRVHHRVHERHFHILNSGTRNEHVECWVHTRRDAS